MALLDQDAAGQGGGTVVFQASTRPAKSVTRGSPRRSCCSTEKDPKRAWAASGKRWRKKSFAGCL